MDPAGPGRHASLPESTPCRHLELEVDLGAAGNVASFVIDPASGPSDAHCTESTLHRVMANGATIEIASFSH